MSRIIRQPDFRLKLNSPREVREGEAPAEPHGACWAVARQEARPPSRGLFRAGGQTHDELENKFVVATKAISSPHVTKKV